MRTEYLREFVVFSRYLASPMPPKSCSSPQSTLSTNIAALESDVGFSLIRPESGPTGTHR
mgnify:CR=1 FL=1